MLNHVRSLLYVWWLIKTLHGTRWTTGFKWAQVRVFDRFGDCFCTCALINWSVLWEESLCFWFMMGKSSWVPSCTQGFIPIGVDGTVYHGYCKNCFCPTVDEEWALGRHVLLTLLICFYGSLIMDWHYVFELWWQMLVSNFKLLPLLFTKLGL